MTQAIERAQIGTRHGKSLDAGECKATAGNNAAKLTTVKIFMKPIQMYPLATFLGGPGSPTTNS
jgi:hypothetical protein